MIINSIWRWSIHTVQADVASDDGCTHTVFFLLVTVCTMLLYIGMYIVSTSVIAHRNSLTQQKWSIRIDRMSFTKDKLVFESTP